MEETIQGMQELLTKLSKLDSLVTQNKILGKALQEGSKLIATEMEHLAPDDPLTPGSRLALIGIRLHDRTSTEAISRIGPTEDGGDRVSEAALAAEFGTVNQAARPFARPAFDAKGDEATAVMGYFLAKAIEREAS